MHSPKHCTRSCDEIVQELVNQGSVVRRPERYDAPVRKAAEGPTAGFLGDSPGQALDIFRSLRFSVRWLFLMLV